MDTPITRRIARLLPLCVGDTAAVTDVIAAYRVTCADDMRACEIQARARASGCERLIAQVRPPGPKAANQEPPPLILLHLRNLRKLFRKLMSDAVALQVPVADGCPDCSGDDFGNAVCYSEATP